MSKSKIVESALPVTTVVVSKKYQYRVVEVLGAGGFGITYKVRRLQDNRILAMKEYFPDKMCERGRDNSMSFFKTNASEIKNGIENFITEAKRLNRENISHPNIVDVYEVFEANDTAYYVMEYIDGKNLRQYIKDNRNKPMSVDQMLSVIRPLLHALTLLHKNKLTHLDIKHDNIILANERDGSLRPVLIDFGQSKHYDRKGNATSTLTNAGCSEGFAPPEQYLGLRTFTPQADVYAVCATILYLLTAQQPVRSSEMSASKILEMLGDEVPESIRKALVRGMNPNLVMRTPSISRLAQELGICTVGTDADTNVTRLLNNPLKKRSVNIDRFLDLVRSKKAPVDQGKLKILGGVLAVAVLIIFAIWGIGSIVINTSSPSLGTKLWGSISALRNHIGDIWMWILCIIILVACVQITYKIKCKYGKWKILIGGILFLCGVIGVLAMLASSHQAYVWGFDIFPLLIIIGILALLGVIFGSFASKEN
ncbi:MAG: serine/threonine protein kinase [Muribaculaceae bacterium]|nr:serine/threonine protein kinase [Muribaculaceae bacterium]